MSDKVDKTLKERLEALIDEARRAYLAYCVSLVTEPMDEDRERLTEAAFIAEALVAAGVCFRLELPREGAVRRCATCLYESALGSDRCVRCMNHGLWEAKTAK